MGKLNPIPARTKAMVQPEVKSFACTFEVVYWLFADMIRVAGYDLRVAGYSAAKTVVKYFQNFCVELICKASSGECAPVIFGPKEMISKCG